MNIYNESSFKEKIKCQIKNSIYCWLISCVYLTFFPHLIFPQNNLHFEHISVEQGLSQSIVTSIVQDNVGFLWFGTEDGLNRYDGYQFTVFKHNPNDPFSVSDNGIMFLFKDRSGDLWIGTDKRGLNKYDYKTGKFIHINSDKDFASSKVNSICDDNRGNLWIGTDKGMYEYNPQQKILTNYSNIPSDPNSISNNLVRSVYCDKDGILWIGTENGLNKYNIQKNIFSRYFYEPASSKNKFCISNIFEDKYGDIWIGTFSKGIIHLNKKNDKFDYIKYSSAVSNSLSSNDVRKIFEDRSGNLWVGTILGLNRFNRENKTFNRYLNNENNLQSLSCNEVLTIYQDKDGIIWIGTFSGGINKLDLGQEAFLHFSHNSKLPNSLSENYVTSIAEDKAGNVWVGTNLMGLNKFDKNTGTFAHYLHTKGCTNCISQNTILSLCVGKSNFLWIGTYLSGLTRYDISTNNFKQYLIDPNNNPSCTNSGTIYSLIEDGNNLWLGTRDGLDKLNIQNNKFTHYKQNTLSANSISDNIIISLFYDKNGYLWIGTVRGGLNRLDPRTEKFKHYLKNNGTKNSISSNRVQAIYQSPENNNYLWVGTDHGLDCLDKTTGQFLHLKEGNELNNVSIFAINSDGKNNLWLSTSKGIIKFNPTSNYLKRFTVKDGLQGIEFEPNASIKGKDGKFYFGGPNGLNIFHPDSIKMNEYEPKIVLSSFKKFNKEIIFNRPLYEIDSLYLSYKDYVISFEFAGLSYSQPNMNRYAYRLDGFDENWIFTDADKRFATYTNLNPGKYILNILGCNDDGIWTKNPATLYIFIEPPFWDNIFFKLAIILILIVIIFVLVNSKLKKLKNERLRQNQFSKLLIESQEEERKRLSKELHDSLGQNLLVIKNWLDIYKSNKNNNEKELDNITDMIKESISEVKEISSNLHPHQLERLGLIKAIKSMAEKIKNSSGIEIETDFEDITGIIPKEYEINIYRIIQESLNNIVKHSGSQNVIISIKKAEETFTISIEDDGKGFIFEESETRNNFIEGFGLKSIKERTRLINGELNIDSIKDRGTKISIKLNTHNFNYE